MLQNQATRDPLTSIYNRRYFETEVKKQITKLTQERKPYSVLMIDADHFKNINDTYGHKIGDKVLIELATKVEKELREKDIVARFGGEEFVVFLPEINSAQAIRVADRLRESIASIIVYTDAKKPVKFTVSIGVSSSEVSNNIDILIKASDKALYKAKQGGRNRVEVFTRKEYMSFEKKGGLPTSENRDKQHPVYNKENNAEISLLDGVNAKDIPNSTIEKKQ
jgi:diguanylate cyclase (GGDEF)-like protein